MPAPIHVTHYTDPGCPWAYSAWPALTTLMWRYGDQLDWTLVTIGLAEDGATYAARGYSPAGNAENKLSFGERFGMPFTSQPPARLMGTGLACRAIVATRRVAPGLELQALRALQFAKFADAVVFDTEDGVRTALTRVPGLDVDAVVAALPAAEDDYQADRARTRSAAGSATEAMGRSANTDGAVRYTAPSLVFTRTRDGAVLDAGGFQPFEVYDACLANLEPALQRRAPAADVTDVLTAFDHPLTTAEVAAICCPHLAATDLADTERRLIDATAAGDVVRRALGDDALWATAA